LNKDKDVIIKVLYVVEIYIKRKTTKLMLKLVRIEINCYY